MRQVDGVGEFYRTDTGERFVPRGVNYIDFVRDENGVYRDAVFATATYDSERVREAFSTLASRGYNTARIFGDTHPGFTRRENAVRLHTAGVETKARFWDDLLAGLADRHAPFGAILGWQFTNEQWLFGEHPPMSLGPASPRLVVAWRWWTGP